MSIRKKFTIGFVVIVGISLTFILYIITNTTKASFIEIEEGSIVYEQKRLESRIDRLQRKNELLLIDWTKWDDAYNYINNRNQNFIESNFDVSFFIDQNIQGVAIYNEQLDLIFTDGYNIDTEETEALPIQLVNIIRSYPYSNGFVHLQGQDYVISTRKVTNTQGTAKPIGLMAFITKFDDHMINIINEDLEYLLEWRYPTDYTGALSQRIVEESTIVIELAVPYLNSTKFLSVRSAIPREITKLADETIQNIIILFLVSFSVLFSIVFVWMDGGLRRLTTIAAQVQEIDETQDISLRLKVDGKDDLATLAYDINNMLDRIENMTSKLDTWASYDQLTGTFSRRRGFYDLEEAITAFRESPYDLTICFIDVNDLKTVNDTLGHQLGDDYLVLVSKTLLKNVRRTDTVSRLGGDEFMIIFPFTTVQEAQYTMTRIEDDLEIKNKSTDLLYHASISYGLAQFEAHMTTTMFVEIADTRMYAHKKAIKQTREKQNAHGL